MKTATQTSPLMRKKKKPAQPMRRNQVLNCAVAMKCATKLGQGTELKNAE